MKLYDCATAPSPRRVRFYIAEKGIELDRQEVDLRHGEQTGDAFRKLNPDCTVPVLQLDNGTCITEVIAICRYLEELHPEPPLFGRDAEERALVNMWISKVEQQGFAAVAEAFRNHAKGFKNRAITGPVGFEQIPALAERGMKRIEIFFDRLEKQFADSEFLVGDYYSAADISAFISVDFAGRLKIAIGEQRPALQRWYDQVGARPAAALVAG